MTEPTLDEQISCLKREIALRKNVYPKWVASGRMKSDMAEREIATMTAALQTVIAAPSLISRLEAAERVVSAARDTDIVTPHMDDHDPACALKNLHDALRAYDNQLKSALASTGEG